MRTNTELALIGLAAVYLAFFSWPVPRIIKQIFQSGVGRLIGLLAVAQLAKQQSAALAIIAAIFQVKSTQAAQHENFTEGFTADQSAAFRTAFPSPSLAQRKAFEEAKADGKTDAEAIEAAKKAGPAARAPTGAVEPPPAVSGNVAASAGSSAAAQPASSGITENFEPFSGF